MSKSNVNKNFKELQKNSKGITLVALVVTIVILIILATVSINVVLGEGGLIQQAKLAKELASNSIIAEEESMNTLMQEYANIMATEPDIPEPDPTPSTVEDAKTEGTVFDEKTPIKDGKDNTIMIPAGFKIAQDSGDTVQQGIVIEDVSASTDANVQGSQYVWIPVGTFKKDDGSTSGNIQLARYTFSTSSPGTPTAKQYATNYTASTPISISSIDYTESATYDDGLESGGLDGRNATAKDLKGFIDSVEENGGYYIGRYEASYASGSSTADYKAASKVSKGYSTSSMSYTKERLWNFITQPAASKVAINTYAESTSVKSDLINSYAWDTAIVYIQEAGNTNYANQTRKHTSLSNTGNLAEGIKDEVCKINDMASNVIEWTTEHSSNTRSSVAYPCVLRGGGCSYSNNYAAYRSSNNSAISDYPVGFRLSLYM